MYLYIKLLFWIKCNKRQHGTRNQRKIYSRRTIEWETIKPFRFCILFRRFLFTEKIESNKNKTKHIFEAMAQPTSLNAYVYHYLSRLDWTELEYISSGDSCSRLLTSSVYINYSSHISFIRPCRHSQQHSAWCVGCELWTFSLIKVMLFISQWDVINMK